MNGCASHMLSFVCSLCVTISQRAERRKQRNFDADYCSTNFVILAELQILEEIIRSNAGRDASEREVACHSTNCWAMFVGWGPKLPQKLKESH